MNEYEQPGEALSAGGISAPVLPRKPRFSASRPELAAALACYVLGWIWFDLRDTGWLLLFVAGFLGLTEWLHCGTPRARESWVWLGCVLVLTAALALERCSAFDHDLASLFLHVFAVWWLLSRSGRLAEGESGRLLPLDALNGFILFPFRHFFLRIRCLWYGLTHLGRGGRRLRTETVAWSAAAALAAALLFLRAAQLLSEADSGFGGLLKDFLAWFSFDFDGMRLLFSLPVGAYVFGLIAGTAREDAETIQARGRRLKYRLGLLRRVPAPVFAVLMSAFALLYLAFFILQGRYLFGAFTRTLPEGFVVAEYARQGFFELCRVTALNFALLWLAARLPSRPLREHGLLRALAAVLLAESLLFAVIAASKLGLYIDCFGFTPKRLQSFWLVCVLAAGCVCALTTLCTGKKSFRAWMIFGASTLSLLCLY
ncbi:MAG: DUF4153 domain-containing protein [Clostridia bacterium]